MIEDALKDIAVALREHTAAIVANTETMRSLVTATPANVVPITPAAKPKVEPKVKPAAKEMPTPAPAVEETPEPEAPVVEETPEPEAPVVEETPEPEAPAAEEGEPEYMSWDEPKLRLAVQEHAKTRLVAPDSKSFKDSFTAELARLGVEKAAKLSGEQLAPFYATMLTWG